MRRLPELVSLRLLLAIGATGSITEAAHREGISQPAASKRMAVLERSLAVVLLERTPAGSRLTPEGLVVAGWASRVFENVDEMFETVHSMRANAAPDLRVASSLTIAEHLVPAWLSALAVSHPTLHVGLRVKNSQEVQELVLDGQVDVGLIETPSLDPRLDARAIGHDRLAVVVSPKHPWAREGTSLRPRDLASVQLIVREAGSGTRETLDRLLAPHDPTDPLLELGSNAAIKGAVAAGAGAAVLSALAVREDLASRRLIEVHVEGADLSRSLLAVWPRRRGLDEASTALLVIASRPREFSFPE